MVFREIGIELVIVARGARACECKKTAAGIGPILEYITPFLPQ